MARASAATRWRLKKHAVHRRSFLTNSAILGLGTTLTDFSGLLASGHARAATPRSVGDLLTVRSLEDFERAGFNLKAAVVKGLDLSHLKRNAWQSMQIDGSYFLGCTFRNTEVEHYLDSRGAFILRRFDHLEYDPYRATLYSADELMAKTPMGSIKDEAIYKSYIAKGKSPLDLIESLTRRVHDFSMDDGLQQLSQEIAVTDMVCITGGFFQDRTDPWFRKTAEVARLLSRDNRFVVTGGGPGIMEAANLGAYLAGYDDAALDTALAILAQAPKWTDPDWLGRALEVKAMFPKGGRSLGIPTWFYGFEPTNLFASEIAKYFDNNIREGILMSIAKGGAVFAPGSAGARQEIFMVATQNHFGSSGFFYPMVLFGKEHYQSETHVFQLLLEVANDNYKDLLYSTDDPAEVLQFIRDHPPRPSE